MSERLSRFDCTVQKHPVLLHFIGVVSVPVLAVFLPVVIYGLLLPLDLSFYEVIQLVPLVPVLVVILIAACLSLAHAPKGIELKAGKRSPVLRSKPDRPDLDKDAA